MRAILFGSSVHNQTSQNMDEKTLPDHGAKALFTTRTRTFEEAAARITREVITDSLRAEVESWGLNIFSDPRMHLADGLPGIEFSVWQGNPGYPESDPDNQKLFGVILDGWSGRMAVVNGIFGDELYEPKQLQTLIRKFLEACLEKLTAVA